MKAPAKWANAGKPFSELDDAAIRKLLAAGNSHEEIAHALGRTAVGVKARAEKLTRFVTTATRELSVNGRR